MAMQDCRSKLQRLSERMPHRKSKLGGPILSAGEANLPSLLKACNDRTGRNPTVIALDMPVSRQPIRARRAAENAVSQAFGGQGCSTHTPSTDRPGPLGLRFSNAAANEGYPIATTQTPTGANRQLIEVYPHIALLRALGTNYRTPYKVLRSVSYWPGTAIPERIARLLKKFHEIHGALANLIENTVLPLPAANNVRTLSGPKRYEDALDALVSAWVGIKYLEQQAIPYGDLHAPIWNAQ